MLWRAHKLRRETYRGHLIQCRDGFVARKRNLDAVEAAEAAEVDGQDIEARIRRIRSNPNIYRPFCRASPSLRLALQFPGGCHAVPGAGGCGAFTQ